MGAKLSGPGGDNKYQEEANSSINVTPFVDVMLVLLIIFMVAAPLAAVTVKVAVWPTILVWLAGEAEMSGSVPAILVRLRSSK